MLILDGPWSMLTDKLEQQPLLDIDPLKECFAAPISFDDDLIQHCGPPSNYRITNQGSMNFTFKSRLKWEQERRLE